MSTTILADAIQGVALSNGILRVNFSQIIDDNKSKEAGTLLIPANQAGALITILTNSLKEISDKLQEQQTTALAEDAIAALESED